MQLTEQDVLVAAKKAVSCRSAYIADEVNRMHAARIGVGGSGHPPRSSLVLRRLRKLAKDGLLECTGGPDGFYGYSWGITQSGHQKLEQIKNTFHPGDHVHHGPSGEDWILLEIHGDEVIPAGWPRSLAKAADCTLVKRDDGTLDRLRNISSAK